MNRQDLVGWSEEEDREDDEGIWRVGISFLGWMCGRIVRE